MKSILESIIKETVKVHERSRDQFYNQWHIGLHQNALAKYMHCNLFWEGKNQIKSTTSQDI